MWHNIFHWDAASARPPGTNVGGAFGLLAEMVATATSGSGGHDDLRQRGTLRDTLLDTRTCCGTSSSPAAGRRRPTAAQDEHLASPRQGAIG